MSFISKNMAAALVGAVAFVALSSASHATTVSIFSTGVDAGGNAVSPSGQADLHYTVVGSGAATVEAPNALYLPNDGSSAWISLPGSSFPNTTKQFDVTFTLTQATDAILSGSWATDNNGVDILINGHSTGISLLQSDPSDQTPFKSLHSFATTLADSAFFQIGLNTLSFQVSNLGDPGAFRAAGLSVTATPIPPSILMFLTALGGMGFVAYRRRSGSLAA
jgi:hypothetical protein